MSSHTIFQNCKTQLKVFPLTTFNFKSQILNKDLGQNTSF
ncbi:hypothetical protein LEP1GSC059_3722 [Leptospira noguchii serovar Panama str. CZ214]|uniref:Uncharacterized protein n=1 Tax=Leptospira noguchii serovar Panama str. CZ214 TaxID=1001595 RepID=T0FS16_9LEPT|nr:hypothetical protein LEP1GSC059_3722 [Leptospira noguchii serovar Panama str. CZ214]